MLAPLNTVTGATEDREQWNRRRSRRQRRQEHRDEPPPREENRGDHIDLKA